MMKKLLILILVLGLVSSFMVIDGAEKKKPVRIVCIGDSITQGRKGGGKHKMTYSWRYPLWKLMVDHEVNVDFVGSLKVGFNGDADWKDYKGKKFDKDHEGHWGWSTKAIREKLEGWIKGYTPDIALIQLGTNDKRAKLSLDDTKTEMKKIIQIIRKKNPKVTVLIGQAFQEWKPFPEMRKKMVELAKEMSTKDSEVITVDHSKGWISKPDRKGTHTVDWVHPNPSGDEKLAKKFFEALTPYLVKAGAMKKPEVKKTETKSKKTETKKEPVNK